jgi:hypothetical protein
VCISGQPQTCPWKQTHSMKRPTLNDVKGAQGKQATEVFTGGYDAVQYCMRVNAVKMISTGCSYTLVTAYKTTRGHIPED